MSAALVLARGRAAAERLMVDRCTIRRRTGETTDRTTGAVVPTYSTLYADQKCRVQTRGYWGEARDIGEAALVLLSVEVQLPMAVTGLQVRDEIVLVSSEHDPDLVGILFRLKDLNHKSHATMRRVLCTEVTG
ncbi:DUF6093 family protein [Glycomyces tarimensis]